MLNSKRHGNNEQQENVFEIFKCFAHLSRKIDFDVDTISSAFAFEYLIQFVYKWSRAQNCIHIWFHQNVYTWSNGEWKYQHFYVGFFSTLILYWRECFFSVKAMSIHIFWSVPTERGQTSLAEESFK